MSHNFIAPTSAFFFLSHKLAVVNLFEQTQHMNNHSYVIARHTPSFPWPGTVGWALGRVSAHKRSVCRVSEANRTRPQTNVQQMLRQISYSFRCKQCANCRGKITPTAVVYIVHTLYIHVWILPLSAKLVHSELLLTHKLATVNLWLLIAAYEQSLICYRTRQANIHAFLAHIHANIC